MIVLLCALTFISVFALAILIIRAAQRPRECPATDTGAQLDERKRAFRRVMDDPALRAPEVLRD
jgi:hypothetical protein